MNWTKEQVEAAQADYIRKMQRAGRSIPAPDRVSSVPCQETGPACPGGENDHSTTSGTGQERTTLSGVGRSKSSQGEDMGKTKIAYPAKPQKSKERKPKQPNKTELRFYQDKILGNINSDDTWGFTADIVIYEGMRLKIADGVIYVPDWVVVGENVGDFGCFVYCYEVKGGFIKDPGRARTKFLVAREKWPHFVFQAWQWKNKQWKEIWK